MGVFGLLSHCLHANCKTGLGREVDLFQEAKQQGGIEIVIDFSNFLYVAVGYSCKQLHQVDPTWLTDDIGYLGGEYHIVKNLIIDFCKCMKKHNIVPVFCDDGARGSDPEQYKNKLETWKLRNDSSVELSRHLADYLQNLGSIDYVRKSNILPWLAKDQVKCGLKANLSNCGGKFIMCNGEADDMMVKYLSESDKAFAVLGNDSDFFVMKNSRFIPEALFDWDSIWLDDGDQCMVTVFTPEDIVKNFGLTSHRELIDIAVLAGNDFTKPLIHKIWGKDRTDLREVISWYMQNVVEGESLEDSKQFKDIVAKNPELSEAVEYSRKFYNLEEVNREENIEMTPLKKYLLKEVKNFKLPSVVMAWNEGIHWGACLLEDHSMPSFDYWTKELRCFLYTMCTDHKQFTVLSRSNHKMLEEQQIMLKHYRWLPKVSEVPMLDDESRWNLFDRIVGYLESPVEHAAKEDIFNGLALHSFFQGYGTKAGFLIHAINHLMTMAYIQKFHINTWEYVTLLATALYCVARETDKMMFEPTWKKPSMRCITIGNWYQYIVKLLYQLSRILMISDHYPEPEETYQGSYFTSLYMTINEKGVSQDYIDPGVLQTFNHILNENHVLDELTKQMMKQELSFIEYLDPNAVSDDSEDESVNMNYSQVPKQLPIEAHKEKILDHINSYRVTCIEGETGSGKSTKVPQFILQQFEDQRAAGMIVQSPRIIVTQPRRLAAKSLASRVANELGDRDVGKKVQYKRGQNHMFSDNTQIYYVTTAYMIELLVHNPRKFEWFTHIILDEIHERDLDADLMSLIVHLLMKTYTRPKIVIMSATLQAKLFVRYFSENSSVTPSAQQHLKVGVKSNHKVQELYLEDLVEMYGDTLSTDAQVQLVKLFCQLKSITISTLMRAKYKKQSATQSSDMVKMRGVASKLILNGAICDKEVTEKPRERVMLSKYMEVNVPLIQALSKPGETILLFLPGRRDIDELYDLLAPYQSTDGSKPDNWKCAIVLYILHSSIPFEDQQQCFETPNSKTCHVVLATNIAESSLTLPRVTVVIDSGMRRHLVYDLKKRVRCLYTGWCSQASMQQRKGRTGRVCDGVCIRLMTREHFSKQPDFDEPQMRIAPLDKLLLQVKYVGRHIAPDKKPSELLLEETVEPPKIDNIDAAVKNLADIGAITAADECANMTLLGQIAMHLPLDLNLCRLIFYGCLFGCPCDAVVMAASLQAQDPFTLPSKKVMKDQEKFISSIRNSFLRRKAFDSNCYSEPIMCRNMYKAWLKKSTELIHRDAEDTDFRSQGNQNPKQDDMRKLKEHFCDKHAIITKRLGMLEGFVSDVAQNVLKCLPRLSENYRKLEELISIVPKRGKKQIRRTIIVEGAIHEGIQGLYRLDDLFSNDILLLNTILAAALAPSFVFGSVQKEVDFRSKNKVPKSLKLEQDMTKAGIDPSKSICILNPPKQFLKDDPLVETMRQEIVRCISLIDVEMPKKVKKTTSSAKKRFSLHYTKDQLFIEYVIPRTFSQTEQSDPKNEITADLHDFVHYPYQFSEAPSGSLFCMELPNKQAIARNDGNRTVKIWMPQNPFRIDWSMMSADGIALKERERPCKAICGWRNPIGFSCDVKKRLHFGVTSKFTKAKINQVGWADGISLFPVYLDNLFSVVLILTFMPKQHGVLFKVDTKKITICEIEIFKYQIPVSSKYPLTEGLMQFINEMRSEISDIFVNMEASIHRQIPDSNIKIIYQKILAYLEEQEHKGKKKRSKTFMDNEVKKGSKAMQKKQSKSESSLIGANRFDTLTIHFDNDDDFDQEDYKSEGPQSRSQSPCDDGSLDNLASVEYNLPRYIKVNSFDLKAPMMSEKSAGNWRAQKSQQANYNDDVSDPPMFQYLAPYDMHIFSKLCLSEIYGTQEELLHAEVETSDEDSGNEYSSSDEDDDMDYISTNPYQNPIVMKENVKTKVMAVLNEQSAPVRLCDLVKVECVKDSISQMNEQLPQGCFDLKQFLENSDGDFVIADINSKNQVVCCLNEMGKILARIIEKKDKSEEYIVSTIYCVLLERRNDPQDIFYLAQNLQKSIKLMNQENEDTEILANLLNNQEAFELVLYEDGKEMVKLRDDIFKKITNDLMTTVTNKGPQTSDAGLRFSAGQKVQIREILFDHLVSHQNAPISFDEIANIEKVQQIIAKTRRNQKTFLIDNNRSVNIGEVFTKSNSWFEVISCSVKLVDRVYEKNREEANKLVKEGNPDKIVTTPIIWEDIECKDVRGDGIWTIQSKYRMEPTQVADKDVDFSKSGYPSTHKILAYDRMSYFHTKIPEIISGDGVQNEIHNGSSTTSLSLESFNCGEVIDDASTSKKSLKKKEMKNQKNSLVEAVSQYCSEKPVLITKLMQKADIKKLWEEVSADKKYNDMETFCTKYFKLVKNRKGEIRVLDPRGMAQVNLQKAEESLKESMLNYCKKMNASQVPVDKVFSDPTVSAKWEKLRKLSPDVNAVQYVESLGDWCVEVDTHGCAWLFDIVTEISHGQTVQSPYHDFRRKSPGDESVRKGINDKSNIDSVSILIQNKIDAQGKAVLLEEIKNDQNVLNEWTKSNQGEENAIADYIAKSGHFLFVEDTLHRIWVIYPEKKTDWDTRIQFDKMFLQVCLRKGSKWIRLNDVLALASMNDQWSIIKLAFSQSSLSTYLESIPYFSVFHDQKNVCWIKVDSSASKMKLEVTQQGKVINPSVTANISAHQVKLNATKQKDNRYEVQYVEKNFVAAVEEYLLSISTHTCLHASLTLDSNVKATWNSLKEVEEPKPMMRDIFAKYSDKFEVGLNEKKAPYVKLLKHKALQKCKIEQNLQSSQAAPIQKAMSLSNLQMAVKSTINDQPTKNELKLVSKIFDIFMAKKKKNLYLKYIEVPDVIEQWKIVKAEGKYVRFIEFLTANTVYFETQRDEQSGWIVTIKQKPKPLNIINPSSSAEEMLSSEIIAVFQAWKTHELAFKQLNLPKITENWKLVKAEGKYMKLIDFISKGDGLFQAVKIDGDEWKIILLSPKDIHVKQTDVGGNNKLLQQPISFKDALLSEAQVQIPLRKAESMMTLPTTKIPNVPNTAAHHEFVQSVRSIFRNKGTNTLMLAEVQNPWIVQNTWKKMLNQNKKIKFTDYLINDTENFQTSFDKSKGWIITLKPIRQRKSSIPSSFNQTNLTGQVTGAVPKTSSSINMSTKKQKTRKIDQEAEMMKGYIEGNFISAVKEFLRKSPNKESLLCDLITKDDSVKDAWICCEEQIDPSPSLTELLGKYTGAFLLYMNDSNEMVVQLNTGKNVQLKTGKNVQQLNPASESKTIPDSLFHAIQQKQEVMQLNTSKVIKAINTTVEIISVKEGSNETIQHEETSNKADYDEILSTKKSPQIGTENRQRGLENIFSCLPDVHALASSWSSNFRDDKNTLESVSSDEEEDLSGIDIHIQEASCSEGKISESEIPNNNTSLKDHDEGETTRSLPLLLQQDNVCSKEIVATHTDNIPRDTFHASPQIPVMSSTDISVDTRVDQQDVSTIDNSSSIYSSPDRKSTSSHYSDISPGRTDIFSDSEKLQTSFTGASSQDSLCIPVDLEALSPSRSVSSEAGSSTYTYDNETLSNPTSTSVHASSTYTIGIPTIAQNIATPIIPNQLYPQQPPLLMNSSVQYSQVQPSLANVSYAQPLNHGFILQNQLHQEQIRPVETAQMMNPRYIIPGQLQSHSFQGHTANQVLNHSISGHTRSHGIDPLIGDSQISMSINGSSVNITPGASSQQMGAPAVVPRQTMSNPLSQGLPTAGEAEMMDQMQIVSYLIDLIKAIKDFCEEHKLKPVEKVVATLGSNFLCNAILNGKTIGEGYGNSKEHATYYAMYNAYVWMKQIFG